MSGQFDPLTEVIHGCVGDGRLDLYGVGALMRQLAPVLARAQVTTREMPYGRYLAALDPAGRYNLQVDVFSAGYVGGAHCHHTWGVFFVLRGTLWTEDLHPEQFHPLRESCLGPGSAAAFVAPDDWHRVRVGSEEQVKSLHLYGPGFDLDVGEGLGPDGRPRPYRRGPLGDLAAIEGLLSWT